MNADDRRRLIDEYKNGYRIVVDALAGATEAELDARPKPGTWSARQVVHHLADSEMTSAIRLRLIVAGGANGGNATILAYDQEAFADRLYYDRPLAASLEAFRAARASTAEILDRMTDDEWQRAGIHSESGRMTAERWLEIYVEHARSHAGQIARARASLTTRPPKTP